jgi:hypothetical protein
LLSSGLKPKNPEHRSTRSQTDQFVLCLRRLLNGAVGQGAPASAEAYRCGWWAIEVQYGFENRHHQVRASLFEHTPSGNLSRSVQYNLGLQPGWGTAIRVVGVPHRDFARVTRAR